MSKKFWYLTGISLKKKVKSKWFIASNIILLVAIVCAVNINTILEFFGGSDSTITTLYVIDNANAYQAFASGISSEEIELVNDNRSIDEIKDNLKTNEVIVTLDKDQDEFLTSDMISMEKIDSSIYQEIVNALSSTKTYVGLNESNISYEILSNITSSISIDRIILSDENTSDENTELIMTSIFPTIILPFFMLVIFLVQMVGGEICEEKTTKSMEIIIANISPKLHLLSKVLASNIFVISQGLLLIIYAFIGLFISKFLTEADLFSTITASLGYIEISNTIIYLVISTIILILLSFVAYAVLSGVLASMTVNIEDFNQLQTPIMLLSMVGYYLAITASMFNGSMFIRILSYIPFLSAYLSPTLYLIGDITIVDMLISIALMIAFIYVLVKKGMKVYKNGILNYSTDKVWSRLFKSMK